MSDRQTPRACKGVEEEYTDSFERPVIEKVRTYLSEQTIRDYSPIVEAVKDVSEITEFKEKLDGNKTLHVVSDMLQHSTSYDYSHYIESIGANEYERFQSSDLFNLNQPDLSGVEVEVLYLLRRKYRDLQTKEHRHFWRTFFEESGAANISLRDLNFFGGDAAPVTSRSRPLKPKSGFDRTVSSTSPNLNPTQTSEESIVPKATPNKPEPTSELSTTVRTTEIIVPPKLVPDAIEKGIKPESTITESLSDATTEQDVPAKPSLSSGTVFKDCESCPEMVVLPTGSYIMGSEDNERDRRDNEGPRMKFTVSGFAFGKFEVTFLEWENCVNDRACRGYMPDSRSWGRRDRPVIYVDWYDARDYAKWLSKKTGKTYRLPSEVEWEYVARAGTSTPFWFGHSIDDQKANYDARKTYGRSGKRGKFRNQTTTVGSFNPNPFGLYDVHGNVWEWTSTCWSEDIQRQENEERCEEATVRGGSWSDRPANLRAAFRAGNSTSRRSSTLGFRVARDL